MPIFEFDEMRDHRVIDGRELLDYWGYNTVSFFAPKMCIRDSYIFYPDYLLHNYIHLLQILDFSGFSE